MTGLINVLSFFLINGLALFASYTASGYFVRNTDAFSLRIVATGVLYFAHMTVSVLFMGVIVAYLTPLSLMAFSAILSLATFFAFKRYRLPFIQPALSGLRELTSSRDIALYLILTLFVIQALVLFAKVIWLPPHIWDVFVYHLPPAAEWYQQQLIPPVLDSNVARINGAPLGMTLLAFWFFSFFQIDTLVELPMLLWALLLVPLSYAIMRQSGVTTVIATKFAVLAFFTPIVLMQAITVKDHLGLNVSFVAGLLFLAAFIQKREPRFILIAFISFGLTIGYKIAAPIFIIIALTVFLILLYSRHREWFTQPTKRLTLIKTGLISGLLTLLIGGYWYIRNLVIFNDLKGAYGASRLASGEFKAATEGALSTVSSKLSSFNLFTKNIQDLFYRLFEHRNMYGADLVDISGFGMQFVIFGIPAFIIAMIALFTPKLRHTPVFLITTTATILLIILFFINYNIHSYRILSFLPMVMIAYAGILTFQYINFSNIKFKYALDILLLVPILWSLVFLLPPQYTNLRLLKQFVTLNQEDRTTANYTRWFQISRPNFHKHLSYFSENESIAFIESKVKRHPSEELSDIWIYQYYGQNWKRNVFLFNYKDSFNCKNNISCEPLTEFMTKLDANNIHLISTCKTSWCFKITDKRFIELAPGFYFYISGKK